MIGPRKGVQERAKVQQRDAGDSRESPKGRHATAYLKLLRNEVTVCDKSSYDGINLCCLVCLSTRRLNHFFYERLIGKADLDILPFETLTGLFHSYCAYCDDNGVLRTERASIRTLTNVFNSMENLRLLGCNGSFGTCEICFNAELSQPGRLSPLIRGTLKSD